MIRPLTLIGLGPISACAAPTGTELNGETAKSSPENVDPARVHLRFAAFIQCNAVGAPYNPYPYYEGDDRSFGFDSPIGKSRVFLDIEIDPHASEFSERTFGPALRKVVRRTGMTRAFWGGDVQDAEGQGCGDVRIAHGAAPAAYDYADVNNIVASSPWLEPYTKVGRSLLRITLGVAASNPLAIGAPNVDAQMEVFLAFRNGAADQYWIRGYHDGYPAYEMYLNGTEVYRFDSEEAGNGPTTLFPPMDITIERGFFEGDALTYGVPVPGRVRVEAETAFAKEPPQVPSQFESETTNY